MNPKSLCFVLPTETDDDQDDAAQSKLQNSSSAKNPPPPPRRRVSAVDSLRHALQRFFLCHHHGNQFSGAFTDADGVHQAEPDNNNPRIFSYSELYIATNGFNAAQILGAGGFGRVYRAVLPSDGTTVAVKSLAESGHTFQKTFMAELLAVAHLRHRNLVRLRGWSTHADDHQLLLVYDYMPNRSLDKILFQKSPSSPLTWHQRNNIVNGLAAALHYLHDQLETQIIHRDVKASNVMLDAHFNARLGDFGLARWLEHDAGNLSYYSNKNSNNNTLLFRLADTTRIGGTIGYLPPESFQKRSAASTAKSDVFSFGIVVLEVVSGRRAVDLTCTDDQIVLLDWIRRLSDDGELLRAGDSRLRNCSGSDMERLLQLGLMCTLNEAHSRPTMKWIVQVLTGNLYGKLPQLPSFRSHPLYISLSSSSSSSSSNNTNTRNTTSNSTTTTGFFSSGFVSANGETIYMSAEQSKTRTVIPWTKKSSANPIVETPRPIAFEKIVSATKNFSKMVAEVDFGTAYYGALDNCNPVIVKRLGMKTCPALRMRFANEFQNLGRLRHRNLIQLRGWCTEQGEMLVVYDYSNCRLLSRALFHHDQNKKRNLMLRWRQRYNIIQSLASAVCYLHEEWDEQVIHRNITSSAVSLDQDANPKLGSFSLAEFLTRNEDGHHIALDKRQSVRGIFGYMSPEYIETGEATTMADVYSFGVVLLEIITGEMAVDFRRPDVLLVQRVHEFEEQQRPYEQLVDRRLDGQFDERELSKLAKLGIACTRSDAKSRPNMRQIASILDGGNGGGNRWLVMEDGRREGMEEWKRRNACTLELVGRIKALGIQ
ncbi:receptor like protein kinase S.2 [Andrographis paniculata]|uniref:receptor like protein kinase S.2 n=1 Tax=Andrographis paniculata TaxID=175694 RepID=UPI0021E7BB00|nr:receptor like protein kinase S.2 [Andrographis paniculata]